jgi:hypothetical protein
VQAISMAGHGLEDYPTTFVSSSLRFEIIAGVFQAQHPGGMEDIMICMDNPLARQLFCGAIGIFMPGELPCPFLDELPGAYSAF